MIPSPPAHSYSRISIHRQCPLMYKFKNIDRIKEVLSDPLVMGSALHQFYYFYAKHCIKKKVNSDIAAIPDIQKQTLEHKELKSFPGRLREEFIKQSEDFGRKEIIVGETIVGVEEKVAFTKDWEECEFFDRKKVPAFRMVMDRLSFEDEETAVIRDYKTGRGEGDKMQMRFYAVGVFKKFPNMKHCRCEFFYTPTGYVAQMNFKRSDLPKLQEELESECDSITKDKKFMATPGDACRYCSYTANCTARPSTLLTVKDEAEAKKVAADLFLLKGQIEPKTKALNGWVKVHGEIVIPTGRWGFTQSESIEAQDEDADVLIKRALQKRKLNPDSFYKLVGKEIKKACSQDPTLMDEIQNALTIKVTETFKGMKPKKGSID